MQSNYENLRTEYENSMTLINEQGDTIAELEAQKKELEDNVADL